MSPHEHFTYREERGFFQRFGLAIALGVVAIVAVILGRQIFSTKSSPPRRMAEMITITPLPPPPPPPPLPPPPPSTVQSEAPKEQMMDQPTVLEEESKPEEVPAPEGLGTNIAGSGGTDFGLSRSGNGVIGGSGTGNGGGGSRFGWYAAQVQRTIADALRSHSKTRNASFVATVRIWANPTGQVTQAKLAQSTGDAVIDRALTTEILPNLQLQEPPPPGLAMPFVTRLTARRPN